jgi:hypothetical protein
VESLTLGRPTVISRIVKGSGHFAGILPIFKTKNRTDPSKGLGAAEKGGTS